MVLRWVLTAPFGRVQNMLTTVRWTPNSPAKKKKKKKGEVLCTALSTWWWVSELVQYAQVLSTPPHSQTHSHKLWRVKTNLPEILPGKQLKGPLQKHQTRRNIEFSVRKPFHENLTKYDNVKTPYPKA